VSGVAICRSKKKESENEQTAGTASTQS